jgi:hypothetical protein
LASSLTRIRVSSMIQDLLLFFMVSLSSSRG